MQKKIIPNNNSLNSTLIKNLLKHQNRIIKFQFKRSEFLLNSITPITINVIHLKNYAQF